MGNALSGKVAVSIHLVCWRITDVHTSHQPHPRLARYLSKWMISICAGFGRSRAEYTGGEMNLPNTHSRITLPTHRVENLEPVCRDCHKLIHRTERSQ